MRYRKLSVPESLIREVERIIKAREDLGYRSVTEFVVDAVRRRVEELKKTMVME